MLLSARERGLLLKKKPIRTAKCGKANDGVYRTGIHTRHPDLTFTTPPFLLLFCVFRGTKLSKPPLNLLLLTTNEERREKRANHVIFPS